ncbi:hypothetical protein D3C80_529200 [compost metagenome]
MAGAIGGKVEGRLELPALHSFQFNGLPLAELPQQQDLFGLARGLFFHCEGHLDLGAGLEKLLVDRHIDSLSLTAKKVALFIFISLYDKDVDSNHQAGRAK